MMQVITTISPVLIMILLGYLLRRLHFFSEQTVKEISALVYWVGLPCLLFYKTSTADFNFAVCGRIYAVLLAGLMGCILAAYLLSALFSIPKASISALVQGAFRANLAYIGLPVVIYSFADAPPTVAESIEAAALFVLALMVLTNNVVAVIVFLLHQHTISIKALKKIMIGLLTNPLLISSVAGLAAGRFLGTLPEVAEKTLSGFSQMVLPLALIIVGATIARQPVRYHLFPAITASFIKLGIYPMLGWLIAHYIFDLPSPEMRLVMIFMACPTAAASYILADQLGGDAPLTATIIVISTLFSILSFSAVLSVF